MKMFQRQYAIGLLLLASLAGCAPAPSKVTRVDPNLTVDLSGKWNDSDSRMVSDEMIATCLNGKWAGEFMEYAGRLPVIMVGTVYNKTDEHISADVFTNDLERAFIESKRARVAQGGAALDEIRAIRQGQKSLSSPEVRQYLREELGVDFVLARRDVLGGTAPRRVRAAAAIARARIERKEHE